MESSAQEHVVGIPLTSFAYADGKTQGQPSSSALILKKSNHLTTLIVSRYLIRTASYTLYASTDRRGVHSIVQTRRVPSSIG
jgi:hypothetical protein